MLIGACNQSEKTQKTLPNIILLMGDDHGWDEVGYNGHPFVKTPVLDEMAASGLRFDRFYSGHCSCSPTRGSFLTGRHPNRYGTFSPGFSIRPEEIAIAHLAKEAGYVTAHFGKWHLGPVKEDSPTNPSEMGFDEYLSHDNFFELGGHSLLATQIISRLRDIFQVELQLRQFFDTLTITGLSESIEEAKNSGRKLPTPAITPIPRKSRTRLPK